MTRDNVILVNRKRSIEHTIDIVLAVSRMNPYMWTSNEIAQGARILQHEIYHREVRHSEVRRMVRRALRAFVAHDCNEKGGTL